MSATLQGAPVAALLGDAPLVTAAGRAHPVRVHYAPTRVDGPVEPAVARTVRRALDESGGDVLVFLPGMAEIRRVEAMLADAGAGVDVIPLHGSQPQTVQDSAIAPSPPGRRKVVLATAIAETSLTIEGVRVVVDSGRMRVPRFSPRTGMTRLETVTVSRASAEQRCGRAGRVGPGVCHRLWTEAEQAALVPHGRPEILEADLTPLALELAAWGVADPAELSWLDPPPAAAFSQARELLRALGALDAAGAATAHGRRMAELPMHPRLAHMVLRGGELGAGGVACDLAALLSDRDVLRGGGVGAAAPADVELRLEALRRGDVRGSGWEADRGAVHRARMEAREWRRRLGIPADRADDAALPGLLLALAYPDRVGQRRAGAPGRFLLRNGRGAAIPADDPLATAAYVVAAEVSGQGREDRIHVAAALDEAALLAEFGAQVETEESIAWDVQAGTVAARRRERLGAIVLRDAPLPDPDPEAVAAALLEGIARAGTDALPWTRDTRQLRDRIAFLHHLDPAWPDVSDSALLATMGSWLRPFLHGMRSLEDLRRLDLSGVLLGMVGWQRREALEELAPSHLAVPSGSRVPIDYADPEAPVLAVRLQEMFGASETPRIAGGRVPLTLHLLSPARRPVQVTQDLASFWRSGYFEVRKDLRGRYPKHFWPDDPLAAPATNRSRRRGT
jgi:ATP-dependent helicase HrpB